MPMHTPPVCVPYAPRQVTVIVHATVLTMLDSVARGDQTVIVTNGRITWVGPSSRANIPKGAATIDAAGKFLLPGLADMHVHVGEADLPLFLVNGITTIRELNGSTTHLDLRRRVCDGSLLGPTMTVSGTLLAGIEQRWRHVLIGTPDDATRVVGLDPHADALFHILERDSYFSHYFPFFTSGLVALRART